MFRPTLADLESRTSLFEIHDGDVHVTVIAGPIHPSDDKPRLEVSSATIHVQGAALTPVQAFLLYDVLGVWLTAYNESRADEPPGELQQQAERLFPDFFDAGQSPHAPIEGDNGPWSE